MIHKKTPTRLILAGLALGATLPLQAASLLTPGSRVFAIDLDSDSSTTNPAEGPSSANDLSASTKYLNFGRENSGIMYLGTTPFTARSLTLTTANDETSRDPASYLIFGSNDAGITVTSPNVVSNGWTLVGNGTLALPSARGASATIELGNGSAYSNYWVVFPTVKNTTANSLQVAEVNLYSGSGGSGDRLLSGAPAEAYVGTSWGGRFPVAENPEKVIDGTTGKYLSFGGRNSGFVVYPSVGVTVPTGFTLTSANDSPERSPVDYTLYGLSTANVWSIISSGTLTGSQMPTAINTAGDEVPVSSTTEFVAYGFVATKLGNVDGNGGGIFQIGEFQMSGDVVPEASSALLGLAGFAALAGYRRRRN